MDENDILEHFGVKGMKWGVRKTRNDSPDYTMSRRLRKKKVREMSNEEIEKVAKRLELEKRYRSVNPSTVAKGSKVVLGILSTLGRVAAFGGTIATLAVNGQKIIDLVKKIKG